MDADARRIGLTPDEQKMLTTLAEIQGFMDVEVPDEPSDDLHDPNDGGDE